MRLSRAEADELKLRKPHLFASESFLRANSAGGAPSRAVAQQAVWHDALAETRREACYTRRIRIRITSFRRRLLDPDNLAAKYFIDGLRYAGLIPDDREEDIALEVRQVKVKSKTSERTEIELT